jgi:hypothetical protein
MKEAAAEAPVVCSADRQSSRRRSDAPAKSAVERRRSISARKSGSDCVGMGVLEITIEVCATIYGRVEV